MQCLNPLEIGSNCNSKKIAPKYETGIVSIPLKSGLIVIDISYMRNKNKRVSIPLKSGLIVITFYDMQRLILKSQSP